MAYLLTPRLCFFIVLKRDLFVYRNDSLTRVVYTSDWDGPIRLKVKGYMSESVQSDIKLSFTSILFF